MNIEQTHLADRVAKHAALADPVRLSVVDALSVGDLSPTELQARLALPSNLLAHHLKVLEAASIVRRRRSEGDRRRSYVTLVAGGLDTIGSTGASSDQRDAVAGADRVVFVCTANSARSQLATVLWEQVSPLPAASGGTHPAAATAPGAVAAAGRHGLRLVQDRPRHLDEVARDGDLLVSVCDSAHEELAGRDAVHWAVPDPVPTDTADAYDAAVDDLTRRITAMADLIPIARRSS